MRIVLRQSLIIAAKDTRVFLKDRLGLAFALLFPLIFVLAFSLALRNVGPGDERLSITVATQEEEGISHQIIEGLAEGNTVDLTVMEYGEAVRATEDGDIGGFVAFPADFTSGLVGGRPTKLEVVARIGDPETEAALVGFANAVAAASSNTRTAVQAIVQIAGVEALPQDMVAFGQDRNLLRFETEQIGPVEPFSAGNFTVPGYLTMFVFFAAALAAEAITRERENHTMERLMANGTRRESVVAGKYLGSVYRGAMQLAVLWGVGLVAFGIDLGFSPAAVILVSVLMVLTSAAFGVMLAGLVRHPDQRQLGGCAGFAGARPDRRLLVAPVHHARVDADSGADHSARLGELGFQQVDALRRPRRRRGPRNGGPGRLRRWLPGHRLRAVPPVTQGLLTSEASTIKGLRYRQPLSRSAFASRFGRGSGRPRDRTGLVSCCRRRFSSPSGARPVSCR